MLNWIVWNTAILTFKCFDIQLFINKNYTYTKLNCLKFNSALNDSKKSLYAVKLDKQPRHLFFFLLLGVGGVGVFKRPTPYPNSIV